MDTNTVIILSGVIALLCFGALLIIFYVARFLGRTGVDEHPYWRYFLAAVESGKIRLDTSRLISELQAEFLARRNEFWSVYGQVVVALVIIGVLAILLITKSISAEAGLPILSAISGFAIAKGVASGRSGSGVTSDRNE